MTIQLSVEARTARVAALETVAGASPKLRLNVGAVPANCAAAEAGTLLAELTLPADWMTQADGAGALAGTWAGTGAAAGVAGHYRIYKADGTTCVLQGTVTLTGGGGDLTLDNTNIAVGQPVTITSYGLTDANG